MATPRTLGEHIRHARVHTKNLKLRELARLIDRAPSYINDIEYDRRTPSEEVLRQLCEVLGLDLDHMLGLAGRLGEDADLYLRRTPAAGTLFRKLSERDFTEDELKRLTSQAEQIAKRRDR
jgi:transcriptional regulator with XRE-family HTH domain